MGQKSLFGSQRSEKKRLEDWLRCPRDSGSNFRDSGSYCLSLQLHVLFVKGEFKDFKPKVLRGLKEEESLSL